MDDKTSNDETATATPVEWVRRGRMDGDAQHEATVHGYEITVTVTCECMWEWELLSDGTANILVEEARGYMAVDVDETAWDYQGLAEVKARAAKMAATLGALVEPPS